MRIQINSDSFLEASNQHITRTIKYELTPQFNVFIVANQQSHIRNIESCILRCLDNECSKQRSSNSVRYNHDGVAGNVRHVLEETAEYDSSYLGHNQQSQRFRESLTTIRGVETLPRVVVLFIMIIFVQVS